MASEREIKLRVKDLGAMKAALVRMGARTVGKGDGRVHEWNIVFDTEGQKLAKKGRLLRIRKETANDGNGPVRFILTFKKPCEGAEQDSHGHKVREEIETEVADGNALQRMMEGLGMPAWFSYEKYRTTMKLPSSELWAEGLTIEMDETPIGNFLELEGPAEAIDRAARVLGYSREQYITDSYLGLYLHECRRRGESSRDMVFDKSK
ncbi:MAG: class IV adenylate cyclase [Acidobacteria bacterium]|nr:class IV adenylate cyclase [Acidobacteriota bacterium]MBS1867510.1 class IV adenylate cyclase [Acidobacteriota bacterium]